MNVLCSSELTVFSASAIKQLVHRTSKYPSYKYLALVSVLVFFWWTGIGLIFLISGIGIGLVLDPVYSYKKFCVWDSFLSGASSDSQLHRKNGLGFKFFNFFL